MLVFTVDNLQNNKSYFYSRKKYRVEAEAKLTTTQVEQELKERFPMCKPLLGLLPPLALCSSQVLSRSWGCRTGRGLGHLDIRRKQEETRNLDKAVLHHHLVHGTWEQKVGISPFMPLYKGGQGGTIESSGLANEQHVALLLSIQQILNKVQLRLAYWGSILLLE